MTGRRYIRNGLSRFALLIAATMPPAGAQAVDDVYFSLGTALRYGHGTTIDENVEASATLQPRLEIVPRSGIEAVVSGLLRYDDADQLLPGEPDFTTYSEASRPGTWGTRTTAELNDMYLEWQRGRQLIRIGKQQIVWGALDGIKVLDALNPQSYREFILEDFGDSRIGLWSLYADVSHNDTRVEVALIPDPTTHYVPGEGAWFELTAPRFRFGAQPGDPELPVETIQNYDPVDDGTAGVRISRRLGRLDLSAVAISGLDFEPLGRLATSAAGTVVERFHERRELFGFSAETAAGLLALRAEVGYLPDRHFNVRDDTLIDRELDQWRAAIAVDAEAPFGVFVNLQYLYDRVLDAPDGLIRRDRDHVITTFLRRTFSYERIATEIRWYTSTADDDGIIRARISYLLGSSMVSLISDTFYGEQEGLFGQFARRDRLTLEFEHTF